MSSLWNSFYSANEPAKIKHQLEVARQRTDQSVQSFYTWIRDMAARADITDDLQLGGYMTNGLLPHVTDNCNHYNIPPRAGPSTDVFDGPLLANEPTPQTTSETIAKRSMSGNGRT